MGQQEVFKVLENKGDWLTTLEIATKLKTNTVSIRRCLNCMHKYREIQKRNNERRNRVGGDSWKI